MEELGDRTPSQFFRRMQQLLGDKAADTDSSFIHELFLQRLPSNTRMVLSSAGDDLPLDKLAALADKIYEVTATPPQTPSTFSPPPVCKVTASDQLVTELSHLHDEVSHLKQLLSLQNGSGYPRRRSPSPVPWRSRDEHQAVCTSSAPPFAASPSPSASIAQELTFSLRLPSYCPGFFCSSQLPPTLPCTST